MQNEFSDVSLDRTIARLMDARDKAECLSILTDDLSTFGFTQFVYGRKRNLDESRLTDLSDSQVVSNFDQEVVEYQIGQRGFANDPLLHWARFNDGALSWGVINSLHEAGVLDDRTSRFWQDMRDFGVTVGYCYSFPTSALSSKSAVGLRFVDGGTQAEADRIWEENEPRIVASLRLFDMALHRIPFSEEQPKLTDRQIEVLTLIAEGKSSRDVSEIFSLHRRTMEDHVRSIRSQLNAETTAHAVALAARKGII